MTALLIAGRMKQIDEKKDENTCGGVTKYNSGEDATKEITSTEIRELHCKFSYFAVMDDSEISGRMYTFDAVQKNNTYICAYEWYTRNGGESESGQFEADLSFGESLHKIAAGHNLAQYNGYYHSVSGLPEMYGDYINIAYASGESIYAKDNQNGFVPVEVMQDLWTLFRETDEKLEEAP